MQAISYNTQQALAESHGTESLLTGCLTLFVFGYLFRPTALGYTSLASLVTLWGYAVVYVLALFTLVKRYKPPRVIWLIVLYYGVYLGCTFVRGGDIATVANSSIKTCLIIYYCSYVIEKKRSQLYSIVVPLLLALVVADLATIVLFPSGIYHQIAYQNEYFTSDIGGWLLGIKNNRILWLFALVVLCVMRTMEKDDDCRTLSALSVVAVVVSIISVTMVKSSTSTMVLLLSLLLILFSTAIHKSNGIFNGATLFTLACVVWLAIVAFAQLGGAASFVSGIFGKDSTFSGRTEIWTSIWQYVLQSPILGYGWQSTSDKTLEFGNVAQVNAHNQFLEVLYDGGIVLALVFLCLIAMLFLRAYRSRGFRSGTVASVFLFLLSIEMLEEVLSENPIFWFVLLLLYFMPTLCRECPIALQGHTKEAIAGVC